MIHEENQGNYDTVRLNYDTSEGQLRYYSKRIMIHFRTA